MDGMGSNLKQKLKSGWEFDVLYARKWHKFNAGICKYVKKCLNKRFRKEGKNLNEEI